MNGSCALLLAAVCSLIAWSEPVRAEVNVSMNVFPNSFVDPSEGADWSLVVRTDSPDSTGVLGFVVRFTDLPLSGVTAAAEPSVAGGIISGMFGDETEFLLTFGSGSAVGLPASPSNLVDDPLGDNAAWGDSSVVATGTIDDITTLPQISSVEATEFDGQGRIVDARSARSSFAQRSRSRAARCC